VVTTTTVSAPITSATVTGLTGGITYDIVVQTANASGFGSASTPLQAVALTVPDTPTISTPTVSSGNTVVSWSEPNNGGAAITSYGLTQYTNMSPEERNKLSKSLLKYCELDTLAMVMIYEHLDEICEA
jgi:hypothetical protein